MFSDLGGDRAHQHKSKMCVLPNIVYCIVLLCCTPPATASSTSSPRSCHLAVAGDRAALPASMTRRPVVLAGSVDSAGTPQQPTPREVKPPHRVGKAAALRRSTDQHELPWLGSAAPIASSTPSTSSDAKDERRYSPKRRPPSCRPKATLPVSLGAMGSGQDHEASDYSFRGTSPPRPLSSPQGNVSCKCCNWRRDDRPRDQVKTRSPSRVPSATSRRHVELSSTRTSSWAGMRVLPARRQVAGVPHWHAQRLLTHLRGDTAVAPVLGASAQGVHTAPLAFLVLKTLTEATAPARSFPLPQAEDTGRALRVPRSPVPTALASLSWCR
jgi:hypothetical protein